MSDLVKGTRIDRYVLEEPLGTGGFSTVYRAHHSLINNQVAFKLLKSEHTRNSVTAERFLREAQTAASIGSPHIVKVLDCGTATTGEMFLVMELLEGRNLGDIIDDEAPMPVERAVPMIQQVLDGLASAHAAGIVHRDIKPDNIFLTTGPLGRPDFVKLLDFGVSKILNSQASALTTAGEVVGTPLYMAPEQITGSDKVDHLVDLYGVAAVLFHMLAGRPPHDAESLPQLAHMILTQEAPPLSSVVQGLPPGLEETVRSGLVREPTARWQTAQSFSEALAPFTPSTATTPGFVSTPATAPRGQAAAPLVTSQVATPQELHAPSIGSQPSVGSQAWTSLPPGSDAGWPAVQDSQPSMPGFVPAAGGTVPQATSPTAGDKRRLPLWALFLIVGLTAVVLGGLTVTVVAVTQRLFSDDSPSAGPTVNPTPTPPTYPPQPPTYPPQPPTVGAPPNTGVPPRSAGLRVGQPLIGALPMGQRIDYPLRVEQRTLLNITLQSGEFDTFLYLLRGGAQIATNDDSNGGFNSQLSMWLEPGVYTVRVGSYGDQSGGQFVLSVTRAM